MSHWKTLKNREILRRILAASLLLWLAASWVPAWATLLDECFRAHGRTTWYQDISEIRADLDRFLTYYNLERSHQGYRFEGRAPAQALREALGLDELPALVDITHNATTGEDTIDQAA